MSALDTGALTQRHAFLVAADPAAYAGTPADCATQRLPCAQCPACLKAGVLDAYGWQRHQKDGRPVGTIRWATEVRPIVPLADTDAQAAAQLRSNDSLTPGCMVRITLGRVEYKHGCGYRPTWRSSMVCTRLGPRPPVDTTARLVYDLREMLALGDTPSRDALRQYADELERLDTLINTPLLEPFLEAVKFEAAHQRSRWGRAHDENKSPEDWFWLIGYLGGKALHATRDGDLDKARHHTISTAAALILWHELLQRWVGAHEEGGGEVRAAAAGETQAVQRSAE